jgi:hypothetical protein
MHLKKVQMVKDVFMPVKIRELYAEASSEAVSKAF